MTSIRLLIDRNPITRTQLGVLAASGMQVSMILLVFAVPLLVACAAVWLI